MSEAEDDSWLEGPRAGADTPKIPVLGLNKRELSAATGYPIKQIDRLCREGLPARSTGSNRGGLRFDLPVVIEWIAAQRETAAGGDDSLADAKRRIALAQARRIELENGREEGRLIQTETVTRYAVAQAIAFRQRLHGIETEFFDLSAEQRDQIRTVIDSALTDLGKLDIIATIEWPSETV